jgi:hypothetical protein
MREIQPIAGTRLRPGAEYSASDLKNAGSVLDAVDAAKLVRITRRNTRFLLIREDRVTEFLADLTDRTPRTLEEMLEGFTPEDADDLRTRTAVWNADKPIGKELL